MKKILATAIGLVLGISFLLAEAWPPFSDLLWKMDINGDKRISRSEWKGDADRFQLCNVDGNAFLTQGEYDRTAKDYADNYDQGLDEFEMFLTRPMDQDHDQKVSAAEFTSYPNPYGGAPVAFADLDKNKDGFVTAEEFAAWFARETLKAQRGIH